MEAWIEIMRKRKKQKRKNVASFTEAWIEIYDCLSNELNDKQPIKSYLLCKKV